MRDTGGDDGRGLPERRHAVALIVFIGVVSLFGDKTYKGARSVTGPFLGTLGASATLVGFVAGFGELVGYAVRFASGWFGDRTRRYWAGAIVGYALNLGSVPLLAIAGSSGIAAGLMIGERMGRAIRSPLRDAMLSHAANRAGLGWGFGLHEALDQTGAVIGPLLVSQLLALTGAYRVAFAMLAVPATMSLILLLLAGRQYPGPQDLEPLTRSIGVRGFAPGFWPYTVAGALIGAGYVDFALVAYHFGQSGVMAAAWIPSGAVGLRHGGAGFGAEGGGRASGSVTAPRHRLWHVRHRARGGVVRRQPAARLSLRPKHHGGRDRLARPAATGRAGAADRRGAPAQRGLRRVRIRPVRARSPSAGCTLRPAHRGMAPRP